MSTLAMSRAVSHAAVLTTHVRRTLCPSEATGPQGALANADQSPVTVGDFAAQCIVTIYLQEALRTEGRAAADFRLVAEEEPSTLTANAAMLAAVVHAVNACFPFHLMDEAASEPDGATSKRRRRAFTADDVLAALAQAGHN